MVKAQACSPEPLEQPWDGHCLGLHGLCDPQHPRPSSSLACVWWMGSSEVALLSLLKEGWSPLGQLGTFQSRKPYPELFLPLRKRGRGITGEGASLLEGLCTFDSGAVWVGVISRGLKRGYPADAVWVGLAVGSCLGNKGGKAFLSGRQAANWHVHVWPSMCLSSKAVCDLRAAPHGCRKDHLLLKYSTSKLTCWVRICPVLVSVYNELHNAS